MEVELNPCCTVLLTLKDLTSLKLLVTRKMSTKSQGITYSCVYSFGVPDSIAISLSSQASGEGVMLLKSF